jgi:hypothetical protein
MSIPKSTVRAFAPLAFFSAFLVFLFGMTSALKIKSSLVSKQFPYPEDLRARIVWGASFVILGIATCWTLSITIGIIKTYLRRRAARLVFVATIIFSLSLGIYTRYGKAGAQTFLARLESATNIHISILIGFMNVGVAAAVILVIASCIALGYTSPEGPTITDLRRRIFDLRVLLFSSAALLVAGVAEIFFLMNWPLHIKALSADPLAIQSSAISAVAGVLYSFILILIYAPTALIHERWRLALQIELSTKDASFDSDAWQKQNGLQSTSMDNLTQIAAIVSPLLVAIGVPALINK